MTLGDGGGQPINSLALHPNGKRVLVHVRDSFIKIVDIENFVVLQTLKGLKNDRYGVVHTLLCRKTTHCYKYSDTKTSTADFKSEVASAPVEI